MQHTRLIRLLGVVLALNLAACAHEAQLVEDASEDASQEFAEQSIAEQGVSEQAMSEEAQPESEQVAQSESSWDTSNASEESAPEAVASNFNEANYQADLASVEQAVETDFAETNVAEANAASAEPTLVAQAQSPTAVEQVVAQMEAAPAPVTPAPTKNRSAQKQEKNRYYVVRAGDTAENVSKLLYKDSAHAKKLTEWNGPSSEWAAGKVIYYVSPKNPGDTHMLSFYEERKLPAETLTVQPGDSLATLAEKHLGSSLSLKEIALVNGLKEDEALKPGQVLQVYPSAVGRQIALAAKAKSDVASILPPAPVKNEAAKESAVAMNSRVPTQAALQEKAADSQVTTTVLEKSDTIHGPAVITLAPVAAEAKPKASLASGLMASVISHHPLILAVAFTVLILFAAFYYLHRRHSGSGFDL